MDGVVLRERNEICTYLLAEASKTFWAMAWADYVDSLAQAVDAESAAEDAGALLEYYDGDADRMRWTQRQIQLHLETVGPIPSTAGHNIMDIMPAVPPCMKEHAWEFLVGLFARTSGGSDVVFARMSYLRDTYPSAEYHLGYCLAMEYLGTGVAWEDDFDEPHGIGIPDYSPSVEVWLDEVPNMPVWVSQMA